MPASFYMPTRLIHGTDSLTMLGDIVRQHQMTNLLVVMDPVISEQDFCKKAISALRAGGIKFRVNDECGIDASLAHVDTQAQSVRDDEVDGIICIGGGSVMCAGKAIAIAAANRCGFRECAGVGNFSNKAIKMIMVPTTAGSGSEVSQFTLVKDKANGEKFVGGGPLSFPDVAILDPDVIEHIPVQPARLAAIDALTHALEALFTDLATPLTDALALSAISLLSGSIVKSVRDRNEEARSDNLLGSAMANMACGNARLGLAHALSLPLEASLGIAHGLGVGVLMPHVFGFVAPLAPEKARRVASSFGIGTIGLDDSELIESTINAIYSLYDDIGFPREFSPGELPIDRYEEFALASVPGLYGETVGPSINSDTIIASPAIRKASIRDVVNIYEQCAGSQTMAAN